MKISNKIEAIIGLFTFLITTLFFSACQNKNTEGKKLYANHCMNCHQEDGKGVGKLIPPISGKFLKQNHSEIPCIIRNGLQGKIAVDGIIYDHQMPKNNKISDFDLVNILNYIEEEFGSGNNESYNIEEVRKTLNNCN